MWVGLHVFGINVPYGRFNGVVGNSEKELLAHFGSNDNEDFDEALSKIMQIGTLRDYRCEFELFTNCVVVWPEKALIDTFMGGLKEEITAEVHMFKPETLREAI